MSYICKRLLSTMSANFKFSSFQDEVEEGSERKDEKKVAEDPQNQMKKVSPCDSSREEPISKAAIHTNYSVTSKTFISQLSKFSVVQLASFFAGVLFVIIILAVMGSNGKAAKRNSAMLVLKTNETLELISKKTADMEEDRKNSDDQLRELIASSVELTFQKMRVALRNFTGPHTEDFRVEQENNRGSFAAMEDRLKVVQESGHQSVNDLEAEMNGMMTTRDRDRMRLINEVKSEANRQIRRTEGRLTNHFEAKWDGHRAEFEEMKREMLQDRSDTRETIGELVRGLKDNKRNFDDIIRDLTKDKCSDPLLHTCDSRADCVSTIKGYTCTCKHGFYGDGKTCQDVNECDLAFHDECHADADCTNTAGSYTCACKSGFSGDGRDKCVDVNECDGNPCVANSVCRNEPGSFECDCLKGYSGDGKKSCVDVDECALDRTNSNEAKHCHEDAICTNNVGSFSCSCKAGFIGNGVNCTDIDECLTGATNCSTHATCINTKGSYSCSCRTGYTGDGKTCDDINECENPASTSCSPNAACTNTHGSYGCTCLPGFTGNGLKCADIDECAVEALNNCSASATCTNTDGGFQCTCLDTHLGDGTNCTVNFMKVSGNYSYHFPSLRKNWFQARDFCRNRGGYLAIIGDEAEDRLIRSRSAGFNPSTRYKYWVGGKCVKTNGVSRNFWFHTDVDFTASYPITRSNNLPNLRSCDTAEDGITISGNFGTSDAWDDIGIRSTPRRISFICEY